MFYKVVYIRCFQQTRERFADDVYSIFKRTQLEKVFHHISNLHQNIKLAMEEDSNGELAIYFGEIEWSLKLIAEIGIVK